MGTKPLSPLQNNNGATSDTSDPRELILVAPGATLAQPGIHEGSENSATSDPRKLFFITPGMTSAQQAGHEFDEADRLIFFPHTTIKYTLEHGAQESILADIERQVRENGTLTEIVIQAHGEPNKQYASLKSTDQDTLIHSNQVLHAIVELQEKLGIKVTNRIVFHGCNTMSDLASDWVNYYRGMSGRLGADIVGTTRIAWGVGVGAFVRFSPDGSISRDPISTSDLALDIETILYEARTVLHLTNGLSLGNNSDAWFESYEGKLPTDGQRGLRERVNNDVMHFETQKRMVFTGAESVVVPSDIPDKLQLSSLGVDGWKAVIDRIGASISNQEKVRLLSQAYYEASTGNPIYEQRAVEAHQDFIRHLSPEDRLVLEREAERYKTEQAIPKPREASRDLSPIKAFPNHDQTFADTSNHTALPSRKWQGLNFQDS
jgi:hypothetical protein